MPRLLTAPAIALVAAALAAPSFAETTDTATGAQAPAVASQGDFGSYITFGDQGSQVAALKVALRHALEDNDRHQAAVLRQRIARIEAGDATTVSGSTMGTPDVSALQIALRQAEEDGNHHVAQVLRQRLGQ